MSSFLADMPISSQRFQELADERKRLLGAGPEQTEADAQSQRLGFVLFDDGMDTFYGTAGSVELSKLASIAARMPAGLRLEGFAITTEKGFDQDLARAQKLAEARAIYVRSLLVSGLCFRGKIEIGAISSRQVTLPAFILDPSSARRVDIYEITSG